MTTTRYLGKCPVCEGDYRLHKMRMVHHGYKRPGHGSIEGDCPGVGWPPYELSTEGTQYYRARIDVILARHEAQLARLQSGEVTELRKVTNPWDRHAPPKIKILTPADGWEFKQELRDRQLALEREIQWCRREIERCDRLIRDWRLLPVRTEEEDMVRKAEVTAVRRGALDAARAARQAKRAAIDAKVAAREQEKNDLVSEYRQIFNELAFRGDKAARIEAVQHWVKMFKRKSKKGYLDFWPSELGIDEALQALNLAKLSERPGRYYYSNEFGWEPR